MSYSVNGYPRVKILPRLRIRELDQNERVFPSQHDQVEFSDNNSLSFVTGTTVNYPLTIQSDTTTILEDGTIDARRFNEYLKSTITTTGAVSRHAIGTFTQKLYTGSIAPFKEYGLHELENHTDQFYMTGSRVKDVGTGFTNPLKHKHSIRFELPIKNGTTLNATSASAYYYDHSQSDFVEVQAHNRQAPTYKKSDIRLFGPTGHSSVSGTYNIGGVIGIHHLPIAPTISSFYDLSLDKESLRILYDKDVDSFTKNSNWNATSTQLFNLKNKIKYPFLVESAIINFHIKAGQGWLNDKTTTSPYQGSDFGGPCVTFAILNQYNENEENVTIKDIVLSASLIPSGDNFSSTTVNDNYIFGFKTLGGTPAGVVNASSSFTGSVTLEAKAAVTNGVIAQIFYLVDLGYYLLPVQLSSPGRSLNNKQSSRSIFGKEFTQTSDILKLEHQPRYPVFINNLKHEVSPYLLFPEDNISFLISKYRSIYSIIPPYPLSSSHDIEINNEKMTVTLYGSYVRNDKEYPYTVKSNDYYHLKDDLNTVIASTVIGDYPVLDQFTSYAYTSQLSGTYLDQYVTGSMSTAGNSSGRGLVLHQFNPGEKESIEDNSYTMRYRKPSEFLNQFTCVKAIDDREIIYNSLVTRATDIWKIDGKRASWDAIYGVYIVDRDIASNEFVNINWTKSFPFEPKYSNLKRYSYKKLKYDNYDTDTSIFINSSDKTIVHVYTRTSDDVQTEVLRVFSDLFSSGDTSDSLTKEDFIKCMFGTGDLFTYRSGNNGYFGTTSFPSYRASVIDAGSGVTDVISPILRGWKYGLYSGLTTYTDIVLNPRNHGQFRDMYEQRIDTRMHYQSSTTDSSERKNTLYTSKSPVQVRFIDPTTGKIVSPEKTNSSNLSLYCTSSLPYFDGVSRNRADVNADYINSSLVRIEDDGSGNIQII